MQISQQMKFIIAGLIAAILIPLATYHYARFAPQYNNSEKMLLAFTPPPAGLTLKTWETVNKNCPVNMRPGSNIKEAPVSSLAAQLPMQPAALPRVSFILFGPGSNMAIVNGIVVKEGNRLKEWRIERIEQNRLLIAGKKGKKWLTIN